MDAGEAAIVTARVADAAALDGDGLRDITRTVYDAIFQRLRGLRACRAVRFWNFVPSIQEPVGQGLDRYMAFNAGRYAVLGVPAGAPGKEIGNETRNAASLPTATGVGHAEPDLVVHCLSLVTPGRAIENPRQISAYRYSTLYGPVPPCFARATAVALPHDRRESLLVGGTASVVGEESWHTHDLVLQFEETCLNLRALIAAWDPSTSADWRGRFREVRVYAPRRLAEVGALVREWFTGAREVEVVRAQLCRDELLIEIEGVVDGRVTSGPRRVGKGVP